MAIGLNLLLFVFNMFYILLNHKFMSNILEFIAILDLVIEYIFIYIMYM